eukprot:534161_1
MGFILILTFVLVCHYIESLQELYPIKSYGFTTNSSLSHPSDVTMRLYWNTFIYQCNATHSNYKNSLLLFSCNINNISNNNLMFCNNTNYVQPKCLLTIWSNVKESITIRSININNNNIFDTNIESICAVGSIDLPYAFTNRLTINLTKDNLVNPFHLADQNKAISTPPVTNLEWYCPKIKVSSIEIITKNSNGDPNGNLNITLFWGYQILECIIDANKSAHLRHFSCNNSEIKLLGNTMNLQYGARLYYNHQYLVRIDSITIIDLYANKYTITTFCGAFQFYYWSEPNTGLAPIPALCQDDYFTNKNLYSFSYIEMATKTACLTTLYITFKKDILMSNTLESRIGLISPAKINSFGVKTAAAIYGESQDHIDLMLYWNLNVYTCSLYINNNNKYFECNEANMNISISNEAAFKIIIGQDHSYDRFKYKVHGLIIEEIRILDSSGYQYIIDSFCLSNREYDTMASEQCTDFASATTKTDLYQFERVKFGQHVHMSDNQSIYYDNMLIEFSNSLFRKPNQSQHSYVKQSLEIKYFGIGITHIYGDTMHITVKLYWHLMAYKCSLYIHDTNKMYYCNSSNSIIEMNQCLMYGMSIDNFDIKNALYFQDIIVHLNNGKYYAINTTNIYLAETKSEYIQFPNNTLDFPNTAHNFGKIVDNIKCNYENATTAHDETDGINNKLELIFYILIAVVVMIFVICISIICMFVYFQLKRKEDMRSPTRKSSQNHLDIKYKSKSKTPSDVGKNAFSYKPVINDNKEEDIDIPGLPSQQKLSKSISSSYSYQDKKEIRIIIEKKKSQKEGFMETELKSENELKVIKASDDIDSDSSLHIPFKNNMFEIDVDNDDNDDEKKDVLNDQIHEGNIDMNGSQINKPQNVSVHNSNVSEKSDSDSDDMYENPGDDFETEQ